MYCPVIIAEAIEVTPLSNDTTELELLSSLQVESSYLNPFVTMSYLNVFYRYGTMEEVAHRGNITLLAASAVDATSMGGASSVHSLDDEEDDDIAPPSFGPRGGGGRSVATEALAGPAAAAADQLASTSLQ